MKRYSKEVVDTFSAEEWDNMRYREKMYNLSFQQCKKLFIDVFKGHYDVIKIDDHYEEKMNIDYDSQWIFDPGDLCSKYKIWSTGNIIEIVEKKKTITRNTRGEVECKLIVIIEETEGEKNDTCC